MGDIGVKIRYQPVRFRFVGGCDMTASHAALRSADPLTRSHFSNSVFISSQSASASFRRPSCRHFCNLVGVPSTHLTVSRFELSSRLAALCSRPLVLSFPSVTLLSSAADLATPSTAGPNIVMLRRLPSPASSMLFRMVPIVCVAVINLL